MKRFLRRWLWQPIRHRYAPAPYAPPAPFPSATAPRMAGNTNATPNRSPNPPCWPKPWQRPAFR